MERQFSFQRELGRGTLYLVATPIGNLGDMSPRAVETLRQVAVIAAEDTRQTRKLLTHFAITGPQLCSYHEHNKQRVGAEILRRLKEGEDVALVCDAGTPGISDPGEELVRAARMAGCAVTSIPGPCAAITALVISGLPTGRFTFIGFLPREKKGRRRELEGLRNRKETLIFYEAPHRLQETLQDLCDVFGDRRAALARELTKRYEEVISGTLAAFAEELAEDEPRGEYVLVVEGASEESGEEEKEVPWWRDLTLTEHVQQLITKGMDKKEAIKEAARERGMPKREVYRAMIANEERKSQ